MTQGEDGSSRDGDSRPGGAPAAASPDGGILHENSFIMRLLREPTTSPRLIRALNAVVVLLLVVLLGNIVMGVDDVHTYVMLALSVGLLASLNWCGRAVPRFAAPVRDLTESSAPRPTPRLRLPGSSASSAKCRRRPGRAGRRTRPSTRSPSATHPTRVLRPTTASVRQP